MSKKQTVYYKNEDDDFEGSNINPITIDGDYKYIHDNFFWNLISFILYRLIATPFAFLYVKLKFGIKFKNKEVLKKYKNTGYFMYANHTQVMGDAFIPTIANFSKRVYVVVHPNNVSIPFWGNIIKFLGPLPIPSDISSGKNFINAISKHIKNNNVVMFYPEAHVWSYYTKIRNFDSNTFKYPINEDAPAFAMTITYKKRKMISPRIIAYIDGPFYPDKNLNNKEKKEDLRNKIYNIMNERAKNSDIEFVKYKKVGEEID